MFKSRRRKSLVAASVLPLLIGVTGYVVWIARQPKWIDKTPSIALIAASPWLDWSDRVMGEALLSRIQPHFQEERLLDWERWLQARISLRVIRSGGPPWRVLLHTYLVVELGVQDDSTTAALLGLIDGSDRTIVGTAARFLASMHPTEEVEIALVRLTEHPDRELRDTAVSALARFKLERPGGRPPEMLFADATQNADWFRQEMACRALGGFDPSPRSREVLLNAAKADVYAEPAMTRSAVVALTMLYPDDAIVRDHLVRVLHELDSEHGGSHCWVVESVLGADRRFVDSAGELSPARRALYSDEVRAAIIDAAAKATKYHFRANAWKDARRLMRSSPVFTEAERARIPPEIEENPPR